MPDLKQLIDRELERVELEPFTLERFHRSRDRKVRNERITAGAAAMAIGVAGLLFAIGAFDGTQSSTPGGRPTGNGDIVVVGPEGLLAVAPGGGEARTLVRTDDLAKEVPNGCRPTAQMASRTEEPFECGFYTSQGEAPYRWSLDGQRLVFAFGLHRLSPGMDRMALFVVDADGSDLRMLTECGTSENGDGCSSLTWSPDGQRVAYTSGRGDLRVAEVDTGSVRTILGCDSCPRVGYVGQAAWSPDGAWIAYSGPSNTRVQVGVVDPDGGIVSVPAPFEPEFAGTGPPNHEPVWSSDGSRILFVSQGNLSEGERSGLSIVDVDGANLTRLELPHDNWDGPYSPTWSPDGSKIMWFTVRGGAGGPRAQLWVAESDGSDAQAIYRTGVAPETPYSHSSTPRVPISPVFSPDGRSIAFSVTFNGERADESGVYIMSIDGTNLHRVSTIASGPQWQAVAIEG